MEPGKMDKEKISAAVASKEWAEVLEMVTSCCADADGSEDYLTETGSLLLDLLEQLPYPSHRPPAEAAAVAAACVLARAMPVEQLTATGVLQRTALHICVSRQATPLLEVLVERLPEEALYAQDKFGCTPLHLADCSLAPVQALVDALPAEGYLVTTGEDQESGRATVLLEQVGKEDNDGTLGLALARAAPGEAFAIETTDGRIPLHNSCHSLELLEVVIAKTPPELYGKTTAHGTLLHSAIWCAVNFHEIEVVERVLEILPPDLFSFQDNQGKTATDIAEMRPRACGGELIELLRETAPAPKGAMS